MRNSPVYLSNSRIVPSELFPDRLGVMGDFNYAASLLVFCDVFSRWKNLVDELSVMLDAAPDLQAGITLAGKSGCVIRVLAHTASHLSCVMQNLWTGIRRIVLSAAPLARRKY